MPMSSGDEAGHPSPRQMPVFQSCPRGTTGHAGIPSADGFTHCHTSTNGCPTIFRCRPCGPARILRSVDEVIDEHAVAPRRVWWLCGQHLFEEVETLEKLDDDAFGAQVGTPHLLDELGVVLALDEDAARPRDPGSTVVRCKGPGRRARAAARRG